jgi:DnaJ-class molecular chaperone
VLRLRGRGVPLPEGGRGDVYITLKIVLPDAPDPALEAFVEGWEAGRDQAPRREMGV